MTPGREFAGLAADSRDVKPGYLFAALPGTAKNGADFIADAVARGAVAVLGIPEAAPLARAAGIRFIADANPRRRLAWMAALFYGAQPETVAAVTGTNGKTSVVAFLRQIWARLGHKPASLGTLGIAAPSGEIKLRHTTPDPVEMHARLAELAHGGVTHLALEASSHGLDQYRLDGVRMSAVAFTNITRDHLDYHPDFDAYLSAKLRLFTELAPDGGVAVVNADAPQSERFAAAARERKLHLLTVGETGRDIRLLGRAAGVEGQLLRITHGGTERDIALPLAGSFQASNALVAAGLAIGLGAPSDQVFDALSTLRGAPGRLELAAFAKSGAPIYVDYAHTPDALETVLQAIRPHVAGKLHVVFGCGGDRDRGKRPLMGAAAARFADTVIVTDDNPRSEDPGAIRKAVLAGCPGAREIGNRAEAIAAAVAALAPGDVLIVAGKGHETGQIVGSHIRPFDDRAEAANAAVALGGRAAGPQP